MANKRDAILSTFAEVSDIVKLAQQKRIIYPHDPKLQELSILLYETLVKAIQDNPRHKLSISVKKGSQWGSIVDEQLSDIRSKTQRLRQCAEDLHNARVAKNGAVLDRMEPGITVIRRTIHDFKTQTTVDFCGITQEMKDFKAQATLGLQGVTQGMDDVKTQVIAELQTQNGLL